MMTPALAKPSNAEEAAKAAALVAKTKLKRTGDPVMVDFDMSTVLGLGAVVAGIGGGIGILAFTENAGKRNEAVEN